MLRAALDHLHPGRPPVGRGGLGSGAPGNETPQGCLPPRLLSKSAGRLAKIRKRPQLGEVLPVHHPAPFSRLAPVDPRSAAERVRPSGPPKAKSPTSQELLEAEPLRVRSPPGAGMNNVTVLRITPPLLGSDLIVEQRTRGLRARSARKTAWADLVYNNYVPPLGDFGDGRHRGSRGGTPFAHGGRSLLQPIRGLARIIRTSGHRSDCRHDAGAA